MLDISTGKGLAANAGHEHPAVCRKDGDGVPEAAGSDRQFFGTERMLKALNRNPHAMPEESLSNVLASIHDFVGDTEQFDDITMLCIKYNGPTDKKQAP